jgi:hypothetical protein
MFFMRISYRQSPQFEVPPTRRTFVLYLSTLSAIPHSQTNSLPYAPWRIQSRYDVSPARILLSSGGCANPFPQFTLFVFLLLLIYQMGLLPSVYYFRPITFGLLPCPHSILSQQDRLATMGALYLLAVGLVGFALACKFILA